MFGMIWGALICAKAGVSMEDYVDQIPLTLSVTHDYVDIFSNTVPGEDFDDPPASLATYHAAFQDVLATCEALGVRDDLPRVLADLLQHGMDHGLGDKQITSLTRLLQD